MSSNNVLEIKTVQLMTALKDIPETNMVFG